MSLIKKFATVYCFAAFSFGALNNWMARKEIKDDIRLFMDDPSEGLILRKYRRYKIKSLLDLQTKPSVQRRYIRYRTINAAGSFLMWPLI